MTPITNIEIEYVERLVPQIRYKNVPIDDKNVIKREKECEEMTEKFLKKFAEQETKEQSLRDLEAGIKALKKEVKILIGQNKLAKNDLKNQEYLN